MGERDDHIEKLESEAKHSGAHIARLESDARDSAADIARLDGEVLAYEAHIAELDARALLRDERIVELMKEVDGLNKAAETRSVIEQAKGTIMAATGCGDEAAFAVLVAQSQAQNRKLREVAADIMTLKRRTEAD